MTNIQTDNLVEILKYSFQQLNAKADAAADPATGAAATTTTTAAAKAATATTATTATTAAKAATATTAAAETETGVANEKQPFDNEYKVTLKVSPSTVKNKDGKATIGDIKIVYDSNHRINSTPDQVDYYLLELARYLKWLTTKDASDETGSIDDFLKSEEKSISFIKNIPVESEIGEGDTKVTTGGGAAQLDDAEHTKETKGKYKDGSRAAKCIEILDQYGLTRDDFLENLRELQFISPDARPGATKVVPFKGTANIPQEAKAAAKISTPTPVKPVVKNPLTPTPVKPVVKKPLTPTPVKPVVKKPLTPTPVKPVVKKPLTPTPVKPVVKKRWSTFGKPSSGTLSSLMNGFNIAMAGGDADTVRAAGTEGGSKKRLSKRRRARKNVTKKRK